MKGETWLIKETRTWYCDACGKEIEGYSGSIDVIEFDDDGFPQSVGYDFCYQCMMSFKKWCDNRRKKADG